MDDVARRAELKAFLRAKRAALHPVRVAPGSRRRAPGLRREEVACAAGVGITWYTWLEQGREINVSRDLVQRLARALQLTPPDEAYFSKLAGVSSLDALCEPPDAIDDYVQVVIEGIDRSPAFVIDPLTDVVAFNRLAGAIYSFDACRLPFGRNHGWRLFCDPDRRRLYANSWDSVATAAVGIMRSNYASRIGDPRFEELLLALRESGEEFNRRWNGHYTSRLSELLRATLSHEKLGRLTMHSRRLSLPERPGYVVFVLPPADEETEATFSRFLASRPNRAQTARPAARGSKRGMER
jgi:transcriptional regulator with XRE-family HTH domain